MHVVATAGHVDHGKSTLVRALTGTDPDRLPEERRRGLTVDLGFAWTRIGAEQVAFVDVPGHERFVPTMLAGVAAAPATLLVVAADEGWMPQTREHVDVLLALGVTSVLVVVTRTDLADPGPALGQVAVELAGTPLAGAARVAVSARTGEGLGDLRSSLVRLVRSVPAARTQAPLRLWVDRSFPVHGAGTVLTGTLTAGRLRVGDRLELADGRPVTVRALQSTGQPRGEVLPTSRVAVNVRGVGADEVSRGDALCTPGRQLRRDHVDVVVTWSPGEVAVPAHVVLHVGTARTPARVRLLDDGSAPPRTARIRLDRPLPLRLDDTCLLRDPGRHEVVAGVRVVDLDPAPLGRGAAGRLADELRLVPSPVGARDVLRRRRVVRLDHLAALGLRDDDIATLTTDPAVVGGSGWLVDPGHAADLHERATDLVDEHRRRSPLEPGPTVEEVRRALDLPTSSLVTKLLATGSGRPDAGSDPALRVHDGRVVTGEADRLPPRVEDALAAFAVEQERPWDTVAADRVRELGLGAAEVAAAVRTGRLVRLGPDVLLLPAAVTAAPEVLRGLPQPFTLAAARTAWGTSRRVALALLEHLDRSGVTRRGADGGRVVER